MFVKKHKNNKEWTDDSAIMTSVRAFLINRTMIEAVYTSKKCISNYSGYGDVDEASCACYQYVSHGGNCPRLHLVNICHALEAGNYQ